jgi:hypothetical protein
MYMDLQKDIRLRKKYYYRALNMKVRATWLPATPKSNKGA